MKTQVIERHFSAVLRSLLTISILANLYACASSGHKNSLPIPKFESVVIVNKGATEELKARFGTLPEDSRIGAGAATGAMLAGTGTAMFCGPFFLLCAIGTVGFATLGAVGGGLAGATLLRRRRRTRVPPRRTQPRDGRRGHRRLCDPGEHPPGGRGGRRADRSPARGVA